MSSFQHSFPNHPRLDEDKYYSRLMETDIKIFYGIILPSFIVRPMLSPPPSYLIKAFMEHQSRALVIGRHIGHKLAKVELLRDLRLKLPLWNKKCWSWPRTKVHCLLRLRISISNLPKLKGIGSLGG